MTKATFESPWWYRHVPRDFMSSPDVQIMTAEECGSYFFLLQNAWLSGQDCTLPNDPERLAKLARVAKLSETVLGKFKLDKEGRLYNPRLLDEWKEAIKRSKDGKKAIQTRWEKKVRQNNDRDTTVSAPNNDSITTNTHTNTHTNTNKKLSEKPDTEAGSSVVDLIPALPSEPATRVAQKLAEILGKRTLKPATVQKWAARAEGVTGEHGEQTVMAVMQWALVENPDGFWRGRIFGPETLSKCFKTMLSQSKATPIRKAADPLAQRAASLQTGHDFTALAKGDL
jgi:uncharacterized protein YdaU (DUF1376 family)